MSRISVELIPRNEVSLSTELRAVKENFPLVDTINVPDLLRFDLRSWNAAVICKYYFPYSIPHIRAIDTDISEGFKQKDFILDNNIPAVLVVNGDLPTDPSRKVYKTRSTDLIALIKKEAPGVKVYGALDQYRTTINEEMAYVERKLKAGADGFFTQPFFDMETLERFHKLTGTTEVFWGVSPVTTEKSKHYWEEKNKVVFSKDFDISLEANIEFARSALAFTQEKQASIYFMPIRTGVVEYLSGVFK